MKIELEMEETNCANCGMIFCVPSHFLTTKREDHTNFFCPAGHSLVFPDESKLENLTKQFDDLLKEVALLKKENTELKRKYCL